jgi:hypothetical protein
MISKIHKIISGCLQPWACSCEEGKLDGGGGGGGRPSGEGQGSAPGGSGGCCAVYEAPATAWARRVTTFWSKSA